VSVIRNLECWLDTIVEDCVDCYAIIGKNNNLEICVFDDEEPTTFSFDKTEVPKVTAFLRSLSVLRVQSKFVKGLAEAIEVYLKLPRQENKPVAFLFKKDGPDPDTIAQTAEGELTTRPWNAE
jgi:hypothetical protein